MINAIKKRRSIYIVIIFLISILIITIYSEQRNIPYASTKISKNMQSSSDLKYFQAHNNYRAWQGVATDGTYIYVATDRDENFGLQDIISVYDMNGNFVKEKLNAYTGTDPQGKFMSFGGFSIIDGVLFATVYNCNSGGSPCISRIVEFSLPTLEVIKTTEIGNGVAESIKKYNGSYWVSYYDAQQIKQFDLSFTLVNTYPLSQSMGPYGGYQGLMWYDGDIYLNMHGPNKYGQTPEGALDRYSFNGSSFTYIETIEPPTYGTTQDVNYYDGCFYWDDRPANRIIMTKSLKSSSSTSTSAIGINDTVDPAVATQNIVSDLSATVGQEVTASDAKQVTTSDGNTVLVSTLTKDGTSLGAVIIADEASAIATIPVDTTAGNITAVYKFEPLLGRYIQITDGVQITANAVTLPTQANTTYIAVANQLASTDTVDQGWAQVNNNWYMVSKTGDPQTGWQKDSTGWVYLAPSNGVMQTGWSKQGDTWYYLGSNGYMTTGWVKDNNNWYYMNSDGSMASNTTIDGYNLDSNGAWIG